MGKNLKAIQNMKREHAQLLRALNRDKVKLGKLKKTQSLHEVDFAQRRIDAAREQVEKLERKMIDSWDE